MNRNSACGRLQLTHAVQQLAILLHRANQSLNKQMLLHNPYLLTLSYKEQGAAWWATLSDKNNS